MVRLSGLTLILMLSACVHEREAAPAPSDAPREQHKVDTAAAVGPEGSMPTTGTVPTGTVTNPTGAPGTVNGDLVRQGYRATLRRGQLMYCRAQQVTGSRFKSQVCLSEQDIREDTKRARDQLSAPRQSQCLGPCS